MENRGICFGNWGYGKYIKFDEFGEYIYIYFFFQIL